MEARLHLISRSAPERPLRRCHASRRPGDSHFSDLEDSCLMLARRFVRDSHNSNQAAMPYLSVPQRRAHFLVSSAATSPPAPTFIGEAGDSRPGGAVWIGSPPIRH